MQTIRREVGLACARHDHGGLTRAVGVRQADAAVAAGRAATVGDAAARRIPGRIAPHPGRGELGGRATADIHHEQIVADTARRHHHEAIAGRRQRRVPDARARIANVRHNLPGTIDKAQLHTAPRFVGHVDQRAIGGDTRSQATGRHQE